jgi:2-polyprenyl-3-methyl-5-hydroxy-6-metoxy-1,4-benzoquinol methylase
MEKVNELTRCLCCEGSLLPLIDLGKMPLVNTYHVTDRFPLAVNRCVSCCHLQLSEFVNPEILYRDYVYCSGTGKTALRYFKEFARVAVSYFPQARSVLDIASNDGSQLDAFKNLGLETYGIDPAENLAEISSAKGHQICSLFFEETKLDRTFDIITAQNVVAHTPRLTEFLEKCASLMDDNSKLFICTSQANLIVNGECDTIYHEHISYFNSHSMVKLAARSGLIVLDIQMQDIHGTSYMFVLGKTGNMSWQVLDRMEWEFVVGLMGAPIYRWWKAHVDSKKLKLRRLIDDYVHQGFYTVGCGAAAKGISMLNMAGIKLDVLVDNTPAKWNRVTNGMEILPFNEIAKLRQDKVLFVILPWNLSPEIRQNVLKLRNDPADVFIETR